VRQSRRSCGEPADYTLRISTGYACFGLVVKNGIISDAAPIGRRHALGKPAAKVVSYYLSRGAKVEVLAGGLPGRKRHSDKG
jgi:hypothetical protein